MSSSFVIAEVGATATQMPSLRHDLMKPSNVDMLKSGAETEVLNFLTIRPVHTIYIRGLIRDNGLQSPRNRGSFYAYRNQEGKLEGVALLGPKTVIEAHSEAALEAFAHLASDNPQSHLIRGAQEQINFLLAHYSRLGRQPRLICRELLLQQLSPVAGVESVPGLRLATLSDQEQVMSINAMMAFEENGVNPLEQDPVGIRKRLARRIKQGREWVLVEGGRIVFKADVISETPEAIFLEGIYVHPEERGRGYGFRCLTQLGRNLLSRTSSLCLVVNAENKKARALYVKAGYQLKSHYRTVYF